MKKYTKRLLAFLLATVMVLTGLPLSAQEVKAADPVDFAIDFRTLDTTTLDAADGLTLTTSTVGTDWKVNSFTVAPAWVTNATIAKAHINCTTKNAEISYDFTAPAAGNYNLTMVAGCTGGGGLIDTWINGVYVGRADCCSTDSLQNLTLLGASLKEGEYANTVKFKINYNTRGNKRGYFRLQALDFAVPTEAAPLATLVLDSNAELTALDLGGTTAITSSFTPSNTSMFETARGSYTYAYEVIGEAVTVDNGTVTAVAGGNATVKVSLLDAGQVVATDTVDFTVSATAGYDATTINLTDGQTFDEGTTLELIATAALTDGTDITNDISVAYTSTNANVVNIDGTTLTAGKPGKAVVTAEVTYDGDVVETFTYNITVLDVFDFYLDLLAMDTTTLADDGAGRYYFTDSTVSAEGAAVPWKLDAENTSSDNYWPKTGLRVFDKPGDVYAVRLMSSSDKATIAFTAPEAGTYNIALNHFPFASGGYAKVYVNDEFVGVVDGYTGTADPQYTLAADLVEGDYANKITVVTAGVSTGTKYYLNMQGFGFKKVNDDARVVTGLTATLDVEAYEMAEPVTGQITAEVTATDDVLVWPTYSVEGNAVKVNASGVVTPLAEGEATITVTAGDFAETFTVTVADSRPTITWVDEDGTELDTNRVAVGGTAEFEGETPVKEGDAQYSYTFAGWTVDGETLVEDFTVAEDVTYTAVYTATLNSYTVTWSVNGEETTETYEYGTVPVAPEVGDIEIDGVAYIFKNWDAEIVAVTGDVTYTAVFEVATQSYTITFVDEAGETLYETTVEAGVTPEYKGETPTKAGDAQFTYTFTGWDPEIVPATVGTTYTVVFEATVNEYTVTWLNADGTELEVDTVPYGSAPEYNGETPTKEADAQYTYVFAGWGVDVFETVTGNVTYTAQYEKTVNKYTITWLDEDESLIKTEEVAYGEVPTCEDPVKEEDVYATYTFAGWTPEVVAVEGEATYTAVYEATPKNYTVTWVVNGVETPETYEAGKMPVAPAVENYGDAQYTYVFTGWDAELAEVTGDVTYTAQFRQDVNTYTITWLNHNGETILSEEVAYGETPVAPTATYKEYTFMGWDAEIVAVEGEATYTAIYDIDGIDEGYYYVDGKVKGNAGVIQIGEDLYFVCYSGKIAAGQNMTVPANKTNGLVEAGTYYFFEDGVMENPADDLLGYVGEDGYYYVKGEVRKNVGVVEIDGLCYYVHYSGKLVKAGNQTVAEGKTNGFVEAGTYYFYANGVMATAAVKASGEVKADGYYYVYDELTKNVGLVELANGDYIYVHYSGKVVQNGYQTVTAAKANGHTEFVGVRKFVDGIMVQ